MSQNVLCGIVLTQGPKILIFGYFGTQFFDMSIFGSFATKSTAFYRIVPIYKIFVYKILKIRLRLLFYYSSDQIDRGYVIHSSLKAFVKKSEGPKVKKSKKFF